MPDAGFHRRGPDSVFLLTAAVVVEVVLPGDKTYDKLNFYADHSVDEVIVANPGVTVQLAAGI